VDTREPEGAAMGRGQRRVRSSWSRLAILAVLPLALTATPAAASTKSGVIVLPGATSAEGIASGRGSTFFAGDLFTGDIFRGDLQHGSAELFIDAPDGRQAAGMKFDAPSGLLFVAGLGTGQGYVYDTATASMVAVYQFADPATAPLINDVTLTREGAWFTDSAHPVLYFVPAAHGVPGAFTTLALSGPAAQINGQFSLNGIAATPDGKTLVVAHTGNASLYTVDPATGASALIEGVSVPNVDGIVLNGHRLWAVQNFSNQISVIRVSPDLSSGVVERLITNSAFEVPTTAAKFGSSLAVINAKFDTGFPPTADQYEVVIVKA
jgi:sugar lactone lactonase YvrE